MTLRTPRRRISPRTRQRYRAIKDFFKRAIGGSSQPDIEINSSTVVNVTELKHKIVGLEQQLSEVNKTCREFINLEGYRSKSQNIIFKISPTNLKEHVQRDDSPLIEPRRVETKILYKTPEINYKTSEGSDFAPRHNREANYENQNNRIDDYDINTKKNNKKKSKVDLRDKDFDMNPNLRRHKTYSAFENVGPPYSTSSLHSFSELQEGRYCIPGHSDDQTGRRAHKIERNIHSHRRQEIQNEQLKKAVPRNYEGHRKDSTVKRAKNRKSKRVTNELDQDFIADIIKRQYKPVQMFGRTQSDMSQLSEPMCRDREFSLYENIQEDTELCSCCYGGCHSPKLHRHSDNSDARSVCDTRLCSTKRNPRFKYRRVHADAYNDSELYDLIPVKEKSSPKTRRKFALDNMANYHDYRELPPSPRTHRPQLNLKAHYYAGSEEHLGFTQHHSRRASPKRYNRYQTTLERFEKDYSSQKPISNKKIKRHKLIRKPEQVHQEIGTTSSLHYPQHFDTEQNAATVDTTLNNTQETVSSTDKTDKALFEIKDILQSFLQEIKKEASSSGKSDISTKLTENCASNPSPQMHASVIPNSGHSFNNYSVPQCVSQCAAHCSSAPTPYIMPPYPNACCYPIMPMYSMNCIQNGYVMPSQSFTCSCAKANDTTDKNKANNTQQTANDTFATETDELIKEIYKFVAQSPTFSRKQEENAVAENQTRNSFEERVYTTRSVGGSEKVSKHNVKVGTPKMKSYSKSCEAIGSRMISDTYYTETNGTTYSESIVENLSLEATATTSFVTELSTERSQTKKRSTPNTKFGKVLRSFGLFKKKKKDAIEEQSETESTIDVKVMKKPPFPQKVTNYMMNNQIYDRPPPVQHDYRGSYYPHDYRPPYNPAMQNYSPPPNEQYYDSRMHQAGPSRGGGPQYHHGHTTAPPYANAYENYQIQTPNQMQPQVPLCLKEIEVKSMATQSERKMSFFRKIKQKMQPPNEQFRNDGARNFSTQTDQSKPGLWKTLQAKALEGKNEPLAYSYSQQKKIAAGDHTMRNAMLKKMFKKRNPFSPRNLIMKTLLGKDKASFGDPPAMYRPSLFM